MVNQCNAWGEIQQQQKQRRRRLLLLLLLLSPHCAGGATYSTIKNREREITEKEKKK